MSASDGVPFENGEAEIVPGAAPDAVRVAALAAHGDHVYGLADIDDAGLESGSRPVLLTWKLDWQFGAPTGLRSVPFQLADRQDLPLTSSLVYAGDMDIDGDHLYLTTLDPGMLRIFSLSDPSRPRQVSEFEIGSSYTYSGWNPELEVQDGRAVVAANDEVRVFDVRDPAAPVMTAVIDAPGDAMDGDEKNAYALDVAAAGDVMYVTSSGAGGLWIAGASPESGDWRVLGQAELPDGQRRIAAVDSGRMWVLVTPWRDGKPQPEIIVKLDVSDPEAPRVKVVSDLGLSWCRHLLLMGDAGDREPMCFGEGGGGTALVNE